MSLVPSLSRQFGIKISFFYNILIPLIWRIKKFSSYKLLKKNFYLKKYGKGKKVFIIGNAPSAKDINFEKAKNIGDIFLCNKFFNSGIEVYPTCYFCLDGKIANGEWDTNLIKQINSNYPNTKIFLNGKLNKKFINKFKSNNNVYWLMPTKVISNNPSKNIDITNNILGFNVAKIMIQVALYMNYEEIYLCGIENNGFVYELQNIPSHLYSGPNEIKDYEKDLWEVSWGYLGWKGIAKLSKNIFNVNKVGFLPWFIKKELDIWK